MDLNLVFGSGADGPRGGQQVAQTQRDGHPPGEVPTDTLVGGTGHVALPNFSPATISRNELWGLVPGTPGSFCPGWDRKMSVTRWRLEDGVIKDLVKEGWYPASPFTNAEREAQKELAEFLSDMFNMPVSGEDSDVDQGGPEAIDGDQGGPVHLLPAALLHDVQGLVGDHVESLF